MNELENHKIAIVIPYYNAKAHIVDVVVKLPDYIDKIYIVNDCSPDQLPLEDLKTLDVFKKINILNLDTNLGVGGATKRGFEKALEDEMEIVVKVDADDQMDTRFLPDLLKPLVHDMADYSKGNRFRDFKALSKMPITRKIGNLGLSFLTKAATGYWDVFDPTNGFFAIKTTCLKNANFNNISNRYFFETSLIAEMYFQKTRIKDIPMPAVYGNEKSSMNVWKIPFEFSPKLFKTFIKRIVKAYFIYDFNMTSVYILLGIPLFLFGVIYGIIEWRHYTLIDELAPTGTIMLITLSIILGFQLILQSIHYDILKTPKSN